MGRQRVHPSITISRKKARRKHAHYYDGGLPTDHPRPQVRAQCRDVPRPCPYVGCRFSLYLDVSDTGSIKLNFPKLMPWEMDPNRSCALDLAEGDGMTLEGVGEAMNVTRERVRQIETIALDKIYMVWPDFLLWMWR